MASRDTSVADLCRGLGVGRVTVYRYVDPSGALRENGGAYWRSEWTRGAYRGQLLWEQVVCDSDGHHGAV